ncbi:MAG: hypothetical protein IAE91_05560 [Ignavibacteriaceae bacterium]|nr:hypothetical protein [Ignavibacteriaceae bacterium]
MRNTVKKLNVLKLFEGFSEDDTEAFYYRFGESPAILIFRTYKKIF